MEGKEQFSAYVVIPSRVFFSRKISDKAKLLYGMFSCMSNAKGFCFAKNDTLAKYLGADTRTIQRMLNELTEHGFVRIENGKGGRKTYREIWITDALPTSNHDKNVMANGDRNVVANHDKNVTQNNINNNNTPYIPQGGVRVQDEIQMRFDRFWSEYPKKADKKKARTAFGKLKVDDMLLTTMLNAIGIQKQTDQWMRGIIPLPTTWLNGRRWEDEVSIATRTTQPEEEEFLI